MNVQRPKAFSELSTTRQDVQLGICDEKKQVLQWLQLPLVSLHDGFTVGSEQILCELGPLPVRAIVVRHCLLNREQCHGVLIRVRLLIVLVSFGQKFQLADAPRQAKTVLRFGVASVSCESHPQASGVCGFDGVGFFLLVVDPADVHETDDGT